VTVAACPFYTGADNELRIIKTQQLSLAYFFHGMRDFEQGEVDFVFSFSSENLQKYFLSLHRDTLFYGRYWVQFIVEARGEDVAESSG
jgi:hypothetical protein